MTTPHLRPHKARLRWPLFVVLLLACITQLHCDPEPGKKPPDPPPNDTKELSLSNTAFAMPAVDFSAKGFFAGHLSKVGTLLGDDSGVYHLSNNKLSAQLDEAIVGIAPWRGQYLIVATKTQLHIFDGSLEPLNLTDKLKLDKTEITAIGAQAEDAMWIGTKEHLWRLKHDKLEAFTDIKAVEQIFAFPGAKEAAIIANKGKLTILRIDDKGGVQLAAPTKEAPAFTQLFPGPDGTLWGIADKKLYIREAKDGQSRWLPYVFGVTDEKPDGDSIRMTTHDNATGQIWAIGAKHIYVLTGDKAQQAKLPDAIKEIKQLSASGGTLWLSDGKQLHQFVRQNTQDITYEGQVALFMKQNCLRCHAQVGPGRPLDTYDIVKQQVQSIIAQIESGAMPADKEPLKDGDVNTIKRWVENKFAK